MSNPKRNRKHLEYRTGKPKQLIVFSLKDFDTNQGEGFDVWQNEQLLAKLLERLRSVSNFSIQEAQQNGILTIYGDFPEKSKFKYPRHIPEGVKWAKISIQGKERIAGYVNENVFYIVFLDKDHQFWITKKKHT